MTQAKVLSDRAALQERARELSETHSNRQVACERAGVRPRCPKLCRPIA